MPNLTSNVVPSLKSLEISRPLMIPKRQHLNESNIAILLDSRQYCLHSQQIHCTSRSQGQLSICAHMWPHQAKGPQVGRCDLATMGVVTSPIGMPIAHDFGSRSCSSKLHAHVMGGCYKTSWTSISTRIKGLEQPERLRNVKHYQYQLYQ